VIWPFTFRRKGVGIGVGKILIQLVAAMAESLTSINYDGDESTGLESLFDAWERGATTRMQAPLSVRSPRYRSIIVGLIKRLQGRDAGTVLSIGAGNGFTELALSEAGFDVLATDKSAAAVAYCREKGLNALKYDFPDGSPPSPNKFAVLYCDGVLGHLWSAQCGYRRTWSRFAELTKENGFLLLSNDLSDDDGSPTLRVSGEPDAQFFRPPLGWLAKDAVASGLWRPQSSRLVRYRRGQDTGAGCGKGRHLRRRELLVLQRSLMNERAE
jgi:SAM-dependent methyltransferase